MRLNLLKSKIHKARVTGASEDYVGSITLDRRLMDAAGIRAHEKVLVADITNGNRFETYAIEGGEGVIEVNGAAAKLADTGDSVIVMAFGQYSEEEAKAHKPMIVQVDEENRVTSQ
ncbi:MAG: aspartate 1-decarboxylase [Candidatus Altiarchaeales archaeon]|nr:aspartate 1-decarboxylase [Candidatus Altiarchaeales archaeon]MBD3416648.1 aspartate 1-decarboxylase [Candidatus Altiarchaeales archaeon]